MSYGEDEELELINRHIKSFSDVSAPTPSLKRLCLRQNLISKLEGLERFTQLVELDLYLNQITTIENLSGLLPNLTALDLSYNSIREIPENGLSELQCLKSLYLANNKITRIQGINHLTNLTVLELGSNRIRTIEGINHLVQLESLWLARNKLTSTKGLQQLTNLTQLSLQNNRLTSVEGLEPLTQLRELYLSENGLESMHGVGSLKSLETLDFAKNFISKIEGLENLQNLEDLWLNDNKIDSFDSVDALSQLKNLTCVYFERNPIYSDPLYRVKITSKLPWLKQLDATFVITQNNPLLMAEDKKPNQQKK